MSRICAALLLFLALPAAASGTGATPTPVTADVGMSLPASNAASTQGVPAMMVNPAGLSFLDGAELDYYHQRGVLEDRVNDAIFAGIGLDLFSLGWGYEWIRPGGLTPSYSRGTLSLAVGDPSLSIGAAWHWFSSNDSPNIDRLSTWDLGIVARPFRALSIGFTALDLNQPTIGGQLFPARWDAGIAIRPLGERFDLGVDYLVRNTGNLDFQDAAFAYTAHVKVIDGISLLGGVTHYYNDKTFAATVGLTLDTSQIGIGYAGATDNKASGLDHTIGVRLSTARHPDFHIGTVHYAVLDVTELLAGSGGTLSALLNAGEDRYLNLLELLRGARTDPDVQGLVLLFSGAVSALGTAHVEELRTAIASLRASGKPSIALISGAEDADYFLAIACDKVYAVPEAGLLINGLSSEELFLGDTLAKIGVRVDVARVGPFKNAPDALTRSDMSAEQREAMTAYLGTVFDRYVNAIAADRKLDVVKVKEALSHGILTPKQAVESGLIDEIKYPDELGDAAKALAGHSVSLIHDYDKWSRSNDRWGTAPHIAIVRIVGTITDGRSSAGSFGSGATSGAENVVKAIEAAAESDDVKAIVVRVDSPGGSGSASNLIERALEKAKAKKPVVISMGNYAASGGYYVAVGGDTIFAEPTTLTGSIGVFVLKPDLSGLLDKVAAHAESINTNPKADIFDTFKPWNDEEQQAMQAYVDAFYDRFITLVGERRKLDKAAVDQIAKGRIWSGRDAKDRGLVDQVGSLDDALLDAKKRAGLDADEHVEVEVMTGASSMMPFGNLDVSAVFADHALESKLNELGLEAPVGTVSRALIIARQPGVMAMLPFELQVH